MKTIWKYELKIKDCQSIPIGDRYAKPLAVAEQNGKLVMWVEHDSGCAVTGDVAICVDIFGTGHPMRETGEYVGTVCMSCGLVWHVYATITG